MSACPISAPWGSVTRPSMVLVLTWPTAAAKVSSRRNALVLYMDTPPPTPSLDGGGCVRNDLTGIPWFPVLDGECLHRFQEFYKTKPRKSTGRRTRGSRSRFASVCYIRARCATFLPSYDT